MKIFIARLYVDDQDKALDFYTQKLGFVKKSDVANGGYRWLTVTSPQDKDGVELLLESDAAPAAKAYQGAMFNQQAPATIFTSEDVDDEYERLSGLGVQFTTPPQDIGPMKIAVFNDTCGNLVQINQPE